MTPMDCDEFEEAAAELALGILPGDQRAQALAHLDRCHRCRLLVADLAHAVDTVVAAAPSTPPPREFARQAARAVVGEGGGPRRARARAAPRALVAGAVMAALAVTLTLGAPRPGIRSVPSGSVSGAALTAPGVRLAGLAPVGPERVAGVVFVQPSSPSWMFITVTDDEKASTYTCELEYADGTMVRAGTFSIRNGAGTWHDDLLAGSTPVARVNVLDPDGTLVARATFS
ncbi:MAG: hypothetical protein LC792_21390 [Actinobacteria bacterium]|nr:hypothetical protein [Actinomycetota bacterium]